MLSSLGHYGRSLAVLTLLATQAPASAATDDPSAGFQVQSLPQAALPCKSFAAPVSASLSNGEALVFDGQRVVHYDLAGSEVGVVTSLSSCVFPSFLLIDPTESFVVFGESETGYIYEAPLGLGNSAQPITNLTFNYDALFFGSGELFVSAAATPTGNGIYRVDILSGSVTLLATVPGPSGPLLLDAAGNLLYGMQFDGFPLPPTGGHDLIRWDAAQLASGAVLDESDATLVVAGFDGITDLALDSSTGAVYLAENAGFTSGANRIRRVGTGLAGSEVLVEGSVAFATLSNLEFLPGAGAARFLGYQPATGGTLRYASTDFVSSFERSAVMPLRPRTSVSGPGTSGVGPFDVRVDDAPPLGFGLVYYGPTSDFDPNEAVLQLSLPIFVGLDLTTISRAPGTLMVDTAGAGTQGYSSPGGLQGLFAIQVLLFDAGGKLAGTSSAAFL